MGAVPMPGRPLFRSSGPAHLRLAVMEALSETLSKGYLHPLGLF